MSKNSIYMTKNTIKSEFTEKLKNKADVLRQNSSYKEAITTYLNSILVDRNDAQAYFGLGMCYKKMNNIDKAIESLEKSALLDSNNFDVFYELGLCFIQEEIPCKAIKCLILAIKLQPDNSEAVYQLGLAHELDSDEGLAMMIYQKLIETSPAFIKAYTRKAQLYKNMKMYRKALSLYLKASKINPNNADCYLEIAKCFKKLGKTLEEKRYYRRYLSFNPTAENTSTILSRIEKIKAVSPKMKSFSLV